MNPWLRIAIVLGLLLAFLSILAFAVHEPTLAPRATKPKVPRLIQVGEGTLEVTAEAVLVMRLATGEVLFARNPEARLPIASLTKLMTAYLLAEVRQPLARVEFSAEAKAVGAPDDKRSSVPAGELLKVEDLQKLLLISSDNDAAYAAAEFIAGLERGDGGVMSFEERIARFVDRMNEAAAAMELVNTHFANPAGSDDPENFSSARDIGRLAEIITERNPELFTLTRTQELFIFGRDGARYGVVNTNPLLQEFPAIYGSKTGFDDEARGALLLLYQIAPGELINVVLLRAQDRFGDGRALIRWLEGNFVLESM